MRTINAIMYHEKQKRQLCALHALNNLFQDSKAFTQKDLDAICYQLSPDSHWFNPHRSILGIGNYDVNIIMKAIQNKGFEIIWFDKRRDLETLVLDKVKGFILNIPNPSLTKNSSWTNFFSSSLNFVVSRRHWISVVQSSQDGHFYNLDSKLDCPEKIGKRLDLLQFLGSKRDGCEIFIVIPGGLSEEQLWGPSKVIDQTF